MPQHNETYQATNTSGLSFLISIQPNSDLVEPQVVYSAGLRDIGAIAFYTIVWITLHCVLQVSSSRVLITTLTCWLQEYIVDKFNRRLNMSRTRLAKFSESAHLAPFAIYSIVHAGYILNELGVSRDITMLWSGYPEAHRYMPLNYKLFFLLQLSFWIHQVCGHLLLGSICSACKLQWPEFYFQKLKRDEIRNRAIYSTLFLGFIATAYFAK